MMNPILIRKVIAPPPSPLRDRLPNRCPCRYLSLSSAGNFFHQTKYTAATSMMTGIPIKIISQKRRYKRNVTRYPVVHKFKVRGTRLVDCASPTNHKNTRIAPITATIAATIHTASIFQCFLTNVFQIFTLDSVLKSVILPSHHPKFITITTACIHQFYITICIVNQL